MSEPNARSADSFAWDSLRTGLDGSLSLPGQAGYASGEPWNRAVPSRPAAVARVASAHDVSRVVTWAAANGYRVAVRRTGHGATPLDADAVLVLTTDLQHLRVNAERATAVVGAGVLWSQVVDVAAEHGLMPVCGSSTSVGVVGFLTGGGIGPLIRADGIGSDRVRSFTVVTGDGRVRRAAPDENPDLFWGLRGGKGTLGIVTSAEIDLLRRRALFGGSAFFAADAIEPIVQAWPRWAAGLPEQATTSVAFFHLPDLPDIPAPLAGRPTVSLRLAWVDVERRAARAALGELVGGRRAVLGGYGPMPARTIAAVHQDPVDSRPFREYGLLLADLPDAAIEALLHESGPTSGTPFGFVEVRQLGGAAARAPQVPDAFCARRARFNVMASGVPVPDAAALDVAADRLQTALAGWSTGHTLANFTARDDARSLRRFWDTETFDRLSALGDVYDPDRVLAIGQVARRVG